MGASGEILAEKHFTPEQIEKFELTFKQLDKDGDSTLSRDEFVPFLTKTWPFKEGISGPGIGKLPPLSGLFDHIDKNHDGVISWQEFLAHVVELKVFREKAAKKVAGGRT